MKEKNKKKSLNNIQKASIKPALQWKHVGVKLMAIRRMEFMTYLICCLYVKKVLFIIMVGI